MYMRLIGWKLTGTTVNAQEEYEVESVAGVSEQPRCATMSSLARMDVLAGGG